MLNEVTQPQAPERPQFPTQDVRFTNNDILQSDELPIFFPKDSSDSSAATRCENSVNISNFSTADNSGIPQAQSSREF